MQLMLNNAARCPIRTKRVQKGVGGLADLGYFLFVDLGGFAMFVPGTVMTLISASAIVLSGWVWFSKQRS